MSLARDARSNTSAFLTLANDRAFFEIAQGFAARMLIELAENDNSRIAAVSLLFARNCPTELADLQDF